MIATLSEMYVPIFGSWTKLLFLVGVWVVLFKTLYVASASHSRLTADFLNLAKFVHYPNAHAREIWIRRFCILYPLGARCSILSSVSPAAWSFLVVFFRGSLCR